MSLVSAVPDKHENKILNEKNGEMRRARGLKQGHKKKKKKPSRSSLLLVTSYG